MTYSPSGRSMPRRSRTSSTLVWPSMSQRVPSTRTIIGSSSSSNSSCEVPHQRFEEVLDGQDPGHAAVLVHHHGDGAAVLAHVGQGLEHAQRLGERDRAGAPCGRSRAGWDRWRPGPRGRPCPVRKMSLTKRMPIRSSRSSWTTGKQLCPDVRTARAMSSAWTGMVRKVTSTRGVMTSRTSMSRRSARASMMMRSCSEASASRGGRAASVRRRPRPVGARADGVGGQFGWRWRLPAGRHGVPDQLVRFAARLELGSGAHQHGHGRCRSRRRRCRRRGGP